MKNKSQTYTQFFVTCVAVPFAFWIISYQAVFNHKGSPVCIGEIPNQAFPTPAQRQRELGLFESFRQHNIHPTREPWPISLDDCPLYVSIWKARKAREILNRWLRSLPDN